MVKQLEKINNKIKLTNPRNKNKIITKSITIYWKIINNTVI